MVVSAVAISLVAVPVPASAAAQAYRVRIYSQFPYNSVAGVEVTGAAATLDVHTVAHVATTGAASDVYLNGDRNAFVQLGIVQGHVGLGECNTQPVYFATPHYFAGERISTATCETLYDLGPATTGVRTTFSLRRNETTWRYYGFVDGVQRWVSAGSFRALYPGVTAEANDTCTDTYHDAQDPRDALHRSLKVYTAATGYRFWSEQYGPFADALYPQYYVWGRPYGGATSYGSGLNPYPSGCP